MKQRYTVIPHVHWDREWYFTEQKSELYLIHDLDEILDELDRREEIGYFLLDAQTSILEDYLEDRPERKEQVKRLVSAGRLVTGPWYTQTDQLIVHGESIVRNLLYGIRQASDLGRCFYVGYAVDCFGQGAQLPQIYNGFNIPYVVFKRGAKLSELPFREFIWQGAAGSSVFAFRLDSYMNFRNPKPDAEENLALLEELEKKEGPRSATEERLLFNGFDQHPMRMDIGRLTQKLREQGLSISIEPMEEALERMAKTEGLRHFAGELTWGQTDRVHKSIFSSRADIKQLMARCENQMIRIDEPLQAMEYELTGRKDYQVFLKRQWKEMMKNAAHDSAGCCNSDPVNRQIAQRAEKVLDALTEYERLTMRRLGSRIGGDPFSLQVYNFLPHERREEVRGQILSPWQDFCLRDSEGRDYSPSVFSCEEVTEAAKKTLAFKRGVDGDYADPLDGYEKVYRCEVCFSAAVPAMGYETFVPVQKDGKRKQAEAAETAKRDAAQADSPCLENDRLRVEIQADGSLQVTDKRDGCRYSRLLVFEDGADAGDSYDYSSTPEDRIYTTEGGQVQQLSVKGREAAYRLTLPVPWDLDARKKGIRDRELLIEVRLSLPEKEARLDFAVTVSNTATDHRLRVCFDTGIESRYSWADQTFGLIRRPVSVEAGNWREEGWAEKPRAIEPMQSYVFVQEQGKAVGLAVDGVKEYEITGEKHSVIAYTLYRSFQKMGRADLPDRPGRASGKPWDTPEAMLLKEMHFSFALCFASCGEKINRMAAEYLTPLRLHQEFAARAGNDTFILRRPEGKQLPPRYSSFALKGEENQFSIYKLGEDHGTILRLCRLKKGRVEIGEGTKGERTLYLCRLDETQDWLWNDAEEYEEAQIITMRME